MLKIFEFHEKKLYHKGVKMVQHDSSHDLLAMWADAVVNAQRAKNKKKCAIKNCCISVREAIKLHPFGTSAKQTRHVCQSDATLLPHKILSSNCIIPVVLYFIA